MPTRKTTPEKVPHKEPLQIRSLALTPETLAVLERVGQDASDTLGWSVSRSAVIRALLQYVQHQPASWATTNLHPLLEAELVQGRVWGHRRK